MVKKRLRRMLIERCWTFESNENESNAHKDSAQDLRTRLSHKTPAQDPHKIFPQDLQQYVPHKTKVGRTRNFF